MSNPIGVGEVWRLALHEERRLSRESWFPVGRWIRLQRQWNTETGHPRSVLRLDDMIIVREADGSVAPWMPTHADLLAWDWIVLDEQAD
jgi:hypothetical protein